MNINFGGDGISVIGMWIAQFVYLLCYFPQMITNYRTKSGRGLSDLFLIGSLNGYIAVLYYTFAHDLPLAYKIVCPLQATAFSVLVFQRLYYDCSHKGRKHRLFYGGNIAGAMMFIPYSFLHPEIVGPAAGWMMFIISGCNQLPQVIKIFKTKSVAGFSLGYILLTILASTIELFASWWANLPWQTLLNAMRNIVVGFIWTVQFKVYSK